MKILISNDDGFFAPGINALIDVLGKEHDLYIVAPQDQQSAKSHALTLNNPIRVKLIESQRYTKGWAVDGTPSDCVKLALEELLDFKPDYILSGINNGPNLGSDIMYSGTVGAAAEGTILGIPAMSISLCGYGHESFENAAAAIKPVVEHFLENPQEGDILVNVNIPNLDLSQIKGTKITTLGNVVYKKPFEERIDPRGNKYYWLAGDIIYKNNHELSDVMTVNEGFISVTPVHYKQTCNETFKLLQKRDFDFK